MKIQYHCECPECKGTSVFERDARWSEKVPIVIIPFSVIDNSWKCKGCGTVWATEIQLHNMTEIFGEEYDGNMPKAEGQLSMDIEKVEGEE